MTASPIAAEVESDMNRSGGSYPDHNPRPRREPHHHENASKVTVNEDFMSDLLDGQQRLITAQYQFLRDGDQGKLLAAQRDMVQCQTTILGNLGVFG